MTTRTARAYLEAGERIANECAAVKLERKANHYRTLAATEDRRDGLASRYYELADDFDRAAAYIRGGHHLRRATDESPDVPDVADDDADQKPDHHGSPSHARMSPFEFFKSIR